MEVNEDGAGRESCGVGAFWSIARIGSSADRKWIVFR